MGLAGHDGRAHSDTAGTIGVRQGSCAGQATIQTSAVSSRRGIGGRRWRVRIARCGLETELVIRSFVEYLTGARVPGKQNRSSAIGPSPWTPTSPHCHHVGTRWRAAVDGMSEAFARLQKICFLHGIGLGKRRQKPDGRPCDSMDREQTGHGGSDRFGGWPRFGVRDQGGWGLPEEIAAGGRWLSLIHI